MTKLTKLFSGIALIAIGGFIFSSCSSTTSPTGGASADVAVTSATTTSIIVGWTRDASDNGSDTLFVMTIGGANVGNSPVTVATGTSTGTVTGLTANTEYTIIVGSVNGRSTPFTFTTWAPPSNMTVLSVSSTSIGAKWTRDPGDMGVDTIVAMNGNVVAGTAPVASGNTGAVSGLVDGTVYTISVRNATGMTNSMKWMTADRTPNLLVYETADPSSSDHSALILGTSSTTSSLSGLQNADFVLETISDPSVPSDISLVAGIVHNSQWSDTKVDPTSTLHPDFVVGGLSADYSDTNYQVDQANSSANSYDIPNDDAYATQGSRVLITTTADNHLALVEIMPDPSTGMLYSTNAAGYKYVTINVSYQSAASQPYAGRGHASQPSAGPVRRISAR